MPNVPILPFQPIFNKAVCVILVDFHSSKSLNESFSRLIWQTSFYVFLSRSLSDLFYHLFYFIFVTFILFLFLLLSFFHSFCMYVVCFILFVGNSYLYIQFMSYFMVSLSCCSLFYLSVCLSTLMSVSALHLSVWNYFKSNYQAVFKA